MPAVSVVILTMGDRPKALAAAVASARATATSVEIVLVANGGSPDHELADRLVEPASNLGIPEGRNVGAVVARAPVVCFLDDDGQLEPGALSGAVTAFESSPDLGAVGLRVVDESGATARRHLPGLRKNPERSGPATSFPGGACVVRRAAFDDVGGLCGEFRYGLEETDLAWRLIDRGWDVIYRSDLRMKHPRTDPTRHSEFFVSTARNRVWLAHRSLPLPLAVLYVANWTVVTLTRQWRSPSNQRAHLRGLRAGLTRRPGPRRPIRWRTVLELGRRGRPPVI